MYAEFKEVFSSTWANSLACWFVVEVKWQTLHWSHLTEWECLLWNMLYLQLNNPGRIWGVEIFSKLDVNSGFWQIPLSKESATLTTLIILFGKFHFNRLPFGITLVSEHFQRECSNVLTGLEEVGYNIDDTLVFLKGQEDF